MKERILDFLGLNRWTEMEKRHFYTRNLVATTFMSGLVIILEIWMCVGLLFYMSEHDKPMTFLYFWNNGYYYVILLTISVVVLGYNIRFLLSGKGNYYVEVVLLGILSAISIWFGILWGARGFAQSDQVFVFMSMVMYVCCVIAWRPWMGLLVSGASFFAFYLACKQIEADSLARFAAGQIGQGDVVKVNYSFMVNLFTLWLMVAVFEVSTYIQTMNEARKEEKLSRIATMDLLTQIRNLRGVSEEFEPFLSRVNDRTEYGVLFINIGNFKAINEKYGLHEGDVFLQGFAKTLAKVFTDSLVGRMGGNHFVVVTRMSSALRKTEKVKEYVQKESKNLFISLKVGVYQLKDENLELGHAIDYACMAMKRIAQKNDEFWMVYDDAFDQEMTMKRFVLDHFEEAIAQHHIQMYLHPIMQTDTLKISGYEALVRWEDPQLGQIMPDQFISTLEEYRLISLLDREMIRQIGELIQQQKEEGYEVVPISLNVSQLDDENYDIRNDLLEMCSRYRISPSLIRLEITKMNASNSSESYSPKLLQLREAGFELWLDDMGSAGSSWSAVKDFDFDGMKIDLSLWQENDRKENAESILKCLIQMAKEMGLHTIAVRVESQKQYELLKMCGCERVQGFLYTRPLTWEQMKRVIESGKLSY